MLLNISSLLLAHGRESRTFASIAREHVQVGGEYHQRAREHPAREDFDPGQLGLAVPGSGAQPTGSRLKDKLARLDQERAMSFSGCGATARHLVKTPRAPWREPRDDATPTRC
jgi:hypothetical protein